jgi:quinol monooxygenase YgiN
MVTGTADVPVGTRATAEIREGRPLFVLTRLRPPEGEATAFARAGAALLEALAARPGFLGGELGRAAEEPGLWALLTRWEGVGSYRRALSAAEVKISGAPVWVHTVDEPGVFLDADDVPLTPSEGAAR